MTTAQVHHHILNAVFKGVERKIGETAIHQFRGIKYANVPARFDRSEPVDDLNGAVVDATQYGSVSAFSVSTAYLAYCCEIR
jgi:carboxylesterase type B